MEIYLKHNNKLILVLTHEISGYDPGTPTNIYDETFCEIVYMTKIPSQMFDGASIILYPKPTAEQVKPYLILLLQSRMVRELAFEILFLLTMVKHNLKCALE